MSFDSEFFKNLNTSGLVKPEVIDQIAGRLGVPLELKVHGREILDELLRLSLVNSWQIAQLLAGRTKFTLGSYTMLDSLGQGGYGQVFLAKTQIPGQLVAVKVLPAAKATSEFAWRFVWETDLQKSLIHPNIVRLLDSGQDGNALYAVHEYMNAGDIRRRIRHELQLPLGIAVQIVIDVADVLAYLHERGILHRDVKPANILVNREGTAKLADFGFCGFVEPQKMNDYRYGKLVGTADYMAPDHIRNPKFPTPLWDVYSLGCTFYQAVTGIVPFPKGDSRQKIIAHVHHEPMDPRIFRHDLPHELAVILEDMMAKQPEKRVQSARIVASRLRDWLNNRPSFIDISEDEVVRSILDFSDLAIYEKEQKQTFSEQEHRTQFNELGLDELDLAELKSETMDLSPSQCLVTLPGHDEPQMIPVPPVIEWEPLFEDRNHMTDFSRDFSPLLILVLLFLLGGIFFLLLIFSVQQPLNFSFLQSFTMLHRRRYGR